MLTEAQFIRSRCLGMIREAGQFEPGWVSTVLDFWHHQNRDHLELATEELPIISFWAGPDDWTLYTTHRVVGSCDGVRLEIPGQEFAGGDWSGFQQEFNGPTVTRAQVRSARAAGCLLYESGYAAAAPIEYFRFWTQKWPTLQKTYQIEARSSTRPFPPLTGS